MSQISLADLNAADKADFVAALANVVEYSPWIAEKLAGQRPFTGINQLHAALMAAIRGWLDRGHAAPRSVRLEISGDVLELSGASPDEQVRLVDAFIARHEAQESP